MKNFHFLIFLFSLFTSFAYAQNISISYSRVNNIEKQLDAVEKEYKHLNPDVRSEMAQLMNIEMNFMLEHSQGHSKFYMVPNEENQSPKELKVGGKSIMISHQKSKMDPHVYKNLIQREVWELKDLFGKGFIVKDSLSAGWEIQREKKMIGAYECIRATVVQNGLEAEAWYTEEIPVFDGPGPFGGLPGLILEVKTPKFNYTALEINVVDEIFKLEKPTGYSEITQQEYDQIYQQRMESLYPSGASVTRY